MVFGIILFTLLGFDETLAFGAVRPIEAEDLDRIVFAFGAHALDAGERHVLDGVSGVAVVLLALLDLCGHDAVTPRELRPLADGAAINKPAVLRVEPVDVVNLTFLALDVHVAALCAEDIVSANRAHPFVFPLYSFVLFKIVIVLFFSFLY